MVVLIKIVQFLLSLSILIVLHEMGHFVMARLFKTRVEKFYLFFDPWFSLFKKKIGDTEYGIGWLPLGGYVKISGMIDESMDREQMAQPPKPYEFRSKKAWQRLLIMLGGVMVNFLLALVIYVFVFFTWGEKYVPMQNLSYGIAVDSLAYDLGFRNGDKVLKLDDIEVNKWTAISKDLLFNEIQTITVERENEIVSFPMRTELKPLLLNAEFPILPRVPFVISALVEGGPADSLGVMISDKVIAVDSVPISYYDQFKTYMNESAAEAITLTVLRGEETKEITVPVENGKIGVLALMDDEYFFDVVELKYSFLESIPAGIKRGFANSADYLKSLKLIFKPEYEAHKSLGGFMRIGSFFPSKWDWQSFWNLTAFLSIMLAIMNLLPIPALDGGHVMFLLYEIVSGRKPGDKFLEYSQIVGMVLLLALLAYANFNDVKEFILK